MPNYRLGEYTDICKKGAAASAKVQKDKSRARWEANRPKCLYCGKQWEWRDDQQGCYQITRRYCNSSCRAKFRWKEQQENLIKEYGESFNQSLLLRRKETVARSHIALSARKIFHKKYPKISCEICGYGKLQVEVAHIRSVKEFSKDTLLGEINNIENLVGLCSNCHREFDNGLISEDLIKSKVAARVKISNGH